MSGLGKSSRRFAARPRNVDAWISAGDGKPPAPRSRSVNTARLTIDVTPELRKRIKLAALQRGLTLADLLRAMLAEAFPDEDQGSAP
ncbi:hypothetical protein NT2_04_02620 [Caenibius tardaugens NBRC 16725]|uniref:Uncharacterized protein n=1 Tax=Caenibius tardaugens NBRC 16725 TaxID=1219035 RepID=U2ZU18_9SPHN|nr:hypothetical protein [Caenibius tardaugens]GAD48849.1 hypothetical protein NT2_04_02620 [Caenibius tardaugens NBRC 16725]